MQLILSIDCDNDAFRENFPVETGRILRHAALAVERGERFPIPLRDYNGNQVGNIILRK